MRKKKNTIIIQNTRIETREGKSINIEIKQTGLIASAEEKLPIYQNMVRTLPPGPAKEKIRDLIRIFKKVLKENEKLQKKVDAKDEFIRQSNVIPYIARPSIYEKGLPELFNDPDFKSGVYDYQSDKKPGIEFKPGDEFTMNEHIMFNTLCSLLYVRSTNKDHKRNDDYLTGDGMNDDYSVILNVSIYDIAKEYNGGKNPPGSILNRVFETIKRITEKRVIIHIPGDNNKQIYRVYGEPLLKLYAIENEKTGKIISGQVWLNPAFRAGIRNNYNNRPRFLNTKITEAVKKTRNINKMSDTDWRLVNLLTTYVNLKDAFHMDEKKLMSEVTPKELKGRKPEIAREKIISAVRVAKELKLITDHKYENSTTGGYKHVFKLNKNWYKD